MGNGKDLHYCHTPLTGTDGKLWRCKCGRKFRYKAVSGRFRRGTWLLIGDGGNVR